MAAFHAVRLPKYALRALVHSPRGLARAIASLWRWVPVFDRTERRMRARWLAKHCIEAGTLTGADAGEVRRP
jgi:hypothetical protein